MATKTCPPGSYVLDAASFVSLQAVRNAVAHPNCDGLELYNGGRYGCTLEHTKIVYDSGKCFGPNWERRANEAMFGSGAWAVDSVRQGVERWNLDPSSVPTILSAVDFSTTLDQWAQLDYWHETACDRADTTDTWIGFYGDTKYGEHLITQDFWTRAGNRPTWTWGGSGMISGTNMKQHYGFPSNIDWSSIGVIVDESRVEAGLAMVAADGDVPGGDNMNGVIIDLRDSWVVFEGAWNGVRVIGPIEWIDGATRADRLKSVADGGGGYDNISRSWRELHGMVYLGSVLPQGDGHPQAPSVNWDGSQFRDWITRGTTPTPVLVPHTHDGGRSGPAIAG